MMKTSPIICAAFALLIGGCEQSPTQDANAAVPAATKPAAPAEKDYYADRINALTDKQRDAVLLKAIKDAGGECASITGSGPHDPVEGHHAWIAHCGADKDLRALDWIVVLGSGGMLSIVRPGAI